ncbi:MAG: amino acid ABC transporter permease [Chloroflexi bacterium]|nr:amino acid ABC transporter permease [Chloroflexota bacterium]
MVQNLPLFLDGLRTTLQLAVGALVLALAVGTLVALLRVSPLGVLRVAGTAYVEFLRNTPLLVQMFFWVFGLPFVGVVLPEFGGALLGLAFYTSAFVAEAVRAGILSIQHGQIEAARAMGLSYVQTMRLVVLPQAIAITVTPLGNLAIALTKNTSVASAVLVPELMYQAEVVNARTFATYETFFVTAALYLALTIPLSRLVARLEHRLTRFRSA